MQRNATQGKECMDERTNERTNEQKQSNDVKSNERTNEAIEANTTASKHNGVNEVNAVDGWSFLVLEYYIFSIDTVTVVSV